MFAFCCYDHLILISFGLKYKTKDCIKKIILEFFLKIFIKVKRLVWADEKIFYFHNSNTKDSEVNSAEV